MKKDGGILSTEKYVEWLELSYVADQCKFVQTLWKTTLKCLLSLNMAQLWSNSSISGYTPNMACAFICRCDYFNK